jgi:hypothetical protein
VGRLWSPNAVARVFSAAAGADLTAAVKVRAHVAAGLAFSGMLATSLAAAANVDSVVDAAVHAAAQIETLGKLRSGRWCAGPRPAEREHYTRRR